VRRTNDAERSTRKFVFDYFVEHSIAPSAPEIAAGLGLPLGQVKDSLHALDEAHHLKLLEGTSRILMAFPFSAIATPFRVTREDGRRYFANCAWDSIAFHPMLNEPVRVDSFCDRCGKAIGFRLEDGKGIRLEGPLPSVLLALPAARWWNDITRTCANTMVFLGEEEARSGGSESNAPLEPGRITVDQVAEMSVPIYSGKLNREYDRPPARVIQAAFRQLGLTGPYWEL